MVVVDVETTGLRPERDALLEVATVVLEGGAVGETWCSLVAPGRRIPPDATAIHGITDDMVAHAPAPAAVAAEIRRRCGAAPLAFHHAAFDLPFVAALLRAAGEPPLLNPVVDTLGLARGLPGAGGHALHELAARFGLPPESRHRALPDALTTARLLVLLADEWQRHSGARSLAELAAASQDILRTGARRDGTADVKNRVDTGPAGPIMEPHSLELFRPFTAAGDSMPATAMLDVGQAAPEFQLKGPGGQTIALSDYRGRKNVLLVFFPLAFSAACAHQLPMVEKELGRFHELGTEVLGISVDSHLANEAFAKQLMLSFPLLSDFRREVCAAYGVLVSERQHSGRAVFLVDRQGKIVYKDVSPAPGDPGQIPNLENVIRVLGKLA